MEEGQKTIVANINKVDLKGKVGTNVRLLKASNVPFEEVPTGKWVDPETFVRQAKSIGAKNIIVKTGTDCIKLMESTLKKAGYVVKTVKRSGLSIITAKAR